MALKNLSMRNRVFLYFSVIVVVFTALSGIVTYKLAENILMEKTIKQTGETILQMSDTYDFYMKGMKDSLTWICNSEVLQEELHNGTANNNDDYAGYDSNIRIIERMIVQAYYSYSIREIAIYSREGDAFLIPRRETEKGRTPEQLHDIAKLGKGRPVIVNDGDSQGSFLVVKQIKDSLTMEDLGVAVLSLRKDYLKSITNNADFSSKGTILLLDEENKSFFDNGHFKITEELTDRMTGLYGYFPYKADGRSYVVIYHKSDNTKWTTIGLVPVSVFLEQLIPFQVQSLFLMVVFLAVSLLASKMLADRMIRPVEDMSEALVRFSGGDFSVRIAEHNGDELGKLGHVFNKTIRQVEDLIDSVVKSKSLEKELEFQALQAQINPHFLYNTMDIINWIAYKNNEMEICSMVQSVSRLMRLSISHKSGNLTLEQEIDYIRDYLYIQKVRYGERLEVVYQVSEEVGRQVIPKFTLQPLVENSIVHGLEGGNGKCLILISARREGEDVVMLVRDTGSGMDERRMEGLFQETEPSSGNTHSHIGLYAVDQRIKYLFGSQYGLTIRSKPGNGTSVTIKIPYTGDEGYQVSYGEVMKRRYEEAQGDDIGR